MVAFDDLWAAWLAADSTLGDWHDLTEYRAELIEEHTLGARFPASLAGMVPVGAQIQFPDGEVRTVRKITPNG
jgi:hypothetical protein